MHITKPTAHPFSKGDTITVTILNLLKYQDFIAEHVVLDQ